MSYYRRRRNFRRSNGRNANNRENRDRSANMSTKLQEFRGMSDTPMSDKKDQTQTANLSYSMIKDLPKAASSILVSADPFRNPQKGASPYPYYNRNNSIINPKYYGQSNIQGSASMQVYDQVNSSFFSYFDMAALKLQSNYRMMCLKNRIIDNVDYSNTQLITECFKAFVEKMNEIEASSFTEFESFNCCIECSIPTGASTSITNIWTPYYDEYETNEGTKYLYTGYAAVFLSLIAYQTYLQLAASTFCYVNKERGYRSHLNTMGYNRENSFLSLLWGKMNSQSWLSNWTTLSANIEGEWIDQEWLNQLNTIAMLVSRKSNSIIDPFLSIICGVNVPEQFVVYTSMTPVTGESSIVYQLGERLFDSANLKGIISQYIHVWKVKDGDDDSVVEEDVELTMSGVCDILSRIMDPTYTMEWARIHYSKSNGNFSNLLVCSHQQYANMITSLLNVLNSNVSYIKGAFRNLKKIIGVLNRVGLNSWKTMKLVVLSNTEVEVTYNTTVNDFFSAYFNGTESMVWNNNSMRWRGTTMFNKYYGIPTFDFYNGGCFLTYSVRKLSNIDSGERTLKLMPYMFDYPQENADFNYDIDNLCFCQNRYGERISLTYDVVNPLSSATLARIVPINSMNISDMRICSLAHPYQYTNKDYGINSKQTLSCLYHFIENLFHIGRINYYASQSTSTITYDVILNSDILMMTDFEIEDITNSMIMYAKTNGPVRTNYDKSLIGFFVG